MSELHRRGHHAEGHRSRVVDEDSSLSQRLLNDANEPSSPSEATPLRPRAQSAYGEGPASQRNTRWSLAIRTTATNVACGFMDLLPTPIQIKFLPVPPPAHVRFMEGWRIAEGIGTPYSMDSAEDTALLRRFWQLCFEASSSGSAPPPPEGLTSELWKRFGFQGTNPATDFRGGGTFSLKNLVFLAHDFPQLFHEFVHREDYPFAVAGINVTLILVTILHLETAQTCLATRQQDDRYSAAQARVHLAKLMYDGRSGGAFENIKEREAEATHVFHQVYRVGCALVHHEWLRSNRNLMAFNSILQAGTRRLINILKCSENLREVIAQIPPELCI